MKKTKQPNGSPQNAVVSSGDIIMIMYYLTSCESEIEPHVCNPCEDNEFGRIRGVAFIHESFEFADGDTTDATEWQRGIDEGKIIVIPRTDGEYPEPSEVTGQGYGDQAETMIGYNHSLTYGDPNYASNTPFYNSMVGRGGYKLAYRTSSKTHITDKTVTIIPKKKIDNDINSKVTWNITVKWSSNQFPVPFDTPEGVFDDCYVPE